MSNRKLAIMLMASLGIALAVGLAYGISRDGSELRGSPASKEIIPSSSVALLESKEENDPNKLDEAFLSKVILND